MSLVRIRAIVGELNCTLPFAVHAQERVEAAGLRGGARGRGGHQAPLIFQVHQLGRHGEQSRQAAIQAQNCKRRTMIHFLKALKVARKVA